MKNIQKHKEFYVVLSHEEIQIGTINSVSAYPVWLGKNRAIMRDVIKYFEKHPPQSLFECMDIIGKFCLNGVAKNIPPDKELLKDEEKVLDKDRTFW